MFILEYKPNIHILYKLNLILALQKFLFVLAKITPATRNLTHNVGIIDLPNKYKLDCTTNIYKFISYTNINLSVL